METGNALPSRLVLYGSPIDTKSMCEQYRLDATRVISTDDYQLAWQHVYEGNHAGIPIHLVTIGRDPRDLIEILPPKKSDEPDMQTYADLFKTFDLDKEWARAIPMRPNEQMPDHVSWELISEREPRLRILRAIAETVVSTRENGYDSSKVWCGVSYQPVPGIKYQLSRLVGRHAISDDPLICSELGYDAAYSHTYEALPPYEEEDDSEYDEEYS